MSSLFSGHKKLLSGLLVTGFLLVFTSTAALAAAGHILPNGRLSMQTPAPTGMVVIKILPGVPVEKISSLVGRLQPSAQLQPRFNGLSKNLGEGVLNRYFQFQATGLPVRDQKKLVAAINADPSVEVAFLEPRAVPAALGFDAFAGAGPAPVLNTPDFEPDQGYLDLAPLGVGAWAMRSQPGALAAGVSIIDIEGGWLWSHEDLPTPFAELGVQVDDLGWRNHGTAVMGEMRGQDNDQGVTGIAPQCSVGGSSISGISVAQALASAVDNLSRGDLILIELHAPGPNANGSGQFGYVPMEYWQDNFDVIRLATAKGIIVCEAAGNGYQNLDGAEYEGLFDRNLRDSGAIMCGATAGSNLYSADFSNNGTRVDLNGWGWDVTTTGYGDLQSGDETEWYTAQFSGTSSASPIVTSSVASLQGMFRARYGFEMDARLARDLLRQSGTPMDSGNLIGTRPNLVAAYALADTVVGRLTGTVTDQETGLPVADVLIQIANQGSFTMSDASGQWSLPLIQGGATLEFSSYYYHPANLSTTVMAGSTVVQDVALAPLDLIGITGRITGPGGPVAGVSVTPTDQPVSSATSNSLGVFRIDDVPAQYDYTLLFDGVPGLGARVEVVSTAGLTTDVEISPVLPAIVEDFGFTDGGFTPDGSLWSYGAPPVEVTGGAFTSWACWGIGMNGDYGDDENDTLNSPSYNLSGAAGDHYYLSFHYFSATETGYDGVNLEVLDDGGLPVLLEPLEGYTDAELGGLGGAPGWSGNSGRWHGTVFDITTYADADFQFRLNFGSDQGVTAQGFFIDGIAFGAGLLAGPLSGNETPVPATTSLQAWPNPFNPQVSIQYAVTRPGQLEVAVYNLRGQRIRTLLQAPVAQTRGILQWDGRRDDGRSVASGVYLVRLVGPDLQTTTRTVVLAK